MATVVLCLAAPADAAPPRQGEIAFANSVPAWAISSADAGATPPATTVEGEIYLPLTNEKQAQRLATAVSTPGSTRYGEYVSAKQWIKRFAPSRKDFRTVEHYLRRSGLTIYATPASRQYIVFRGPASDVGPAFGTALHDYHYDGKLLHAPATAPRLPAGVGALVSGVSLDSSRTLTRPASAEPIGEQPTPAPKSGGITPRALSALPQYACSSYYGQNSGKTPRAYGRKQFPTFLCGYLPDQLRSGYNLNKLITAGNDGTGQTVAIIDAYASPTIEQDTNDYMRTVGSPLLTRFRQLLPEQPYVDVGLCGGQAGWQGEQTLDVESAHSIAPGASILYVGGFNCGGGLDIAMSTILDNQLATIVSNSYGNYGEAVPGSAVLGEQNLHLQAAAEGIGLYFSSGDSGDETVNLGYPSPDFPASSPYVTAVGGTSKAIGADGRTEFNTGWGSVLDQMTLTPNGKVKFTEPPPGTLWGGGAGGGTSALFAQPAYQRGIVPDALADAGDGTPARVVPDVAALADPYTGFQIALRPIDDSTCQPDGTCQQGPLVYETYGGTSLASPITAAQMALVQQASGAVIGFANPALYNAARMGTGSYDDVAPPGQPQALAYTSARSGNDYLVTLDRDTSLQTADGYDAVTGLGEASATGLAGYFAGQLG